MYNFIDKEGE